MAFKPNLNIVKKPIVEEKPTVESNLKNQLYKLLKFKLTGFEREELIALTEDIYEVFERKK